MAHGKLRKLIPGVSQLLCVKQVLFKAIEAWFEHRASSKGAALAFYTLFSLTPILVLSIAFVGYFFGADTAQDEIIHQIRGLVGPNGADATRVMLAAAHNKSSGHWAAIIAAVLLLVGATSVFTELKGSLDEIWGNTARKSSALSTALKTRLLSFSIVVALAFLLLISLIVNAALALLQTYADSIFGPIIGVFSFVSVAMTYIVIAVMFAFIYKMLPDEPLSWSDVGAGAAFTAGLFILGKYAIGLYLGNSSIASGYGAAGSLVALLLWVYYSAQIFFFGAEFTRQYAITFGSRRHRYAGNHPTP